MTSNSLKNREIEETARSNRAKERETERSNREKESLGRKELGAKYLSSVGTFLKGGSTAFGGKRNYSGNHPSWYTDNDQLVTDSANLSTVEVIGPEVTYNDANPRTRYIPGILKIGFAPTIGRTVDKDDIATTVTRNIYTFVRHANSGHANYDAPDLEMYFLAMDTVFMIIGEAERAYKAYLTENRFNRYVNPGLRQALNPNLQNELADFRYAINSAKLKVGSLVVPADISYYARHAWLVSNVFKDNQNHKAQLYYYAPEWVYYYDETNNKLVTQSWDFSSLANVQAWVTEFNKYADYLLESESIQIMSGDILKAYGENGVLRLQDLAADQALDVAYDEHALTQLHNTDLVGALIQTDLDVKQDNAGHIYQGSFNYGNTDYGIIRGVNQTMTGFKAAHNNVAIQTPFLSFNEDSLTPDYALVYTRNKVSYTVEEITSGTFNVYVRTYGTEIFTKATLYYFTAGNGAIVKHANSFQKMSFRMSETEINDEIRLLSLFDWLPSIGFFTSANSANPAELYELKNYKIIPVRTLSNMHKTAVYSEFTVKQMGRAKR